MPRAHKAPADGATSGRCRHFSGPLGRYHGLQLKPECEDPGYSHCTGKPHGLHGSTGPPDGKDLLAQPPARPSASASIQRPRSLVPARRLASSMIPSLASILVLVLPGLTLAMPVSFAVLGSLSGQAECSSGCPSPYSPNILDFPCRHQEELVEFTGWGQTHKSPTDGSQHTPKQQPWADPGSPPPPLCPTGPPCPPSHPLRF